MTIHLDPRASLEVAEFARALRVAMRSCRRGIVAGRDRVLAYDALGARAGEIAGAFGEAGGAPVAICARKLPDVIAAVLGVLESGRAYAPLDPSHPAARRIAILEQLAPSALIIDADGQADLGDWAEKSGIPALLLENLPGAGEASTIAVPNRVAAVLHTSGSTGVPKQVRIGAAAIEIFTRWVRREFALSAADCVLSHAPLAFDLSFLDIFASLSAGASIALADGNDTRSGERLVSIIKDRQVTFLHAAPSALALIAGAAEGRVFPGVRAVLFAGEPMPARTLQSLMEIFPSARFTNIYGCTETNDTFSYDVPRKGVPDPLPLGIPLPYVEYAIMTDEGRPAAAGQEGELWVRCPTMMDGYSDPGLTAMALGHLGGRTYYRSKDRVRRGDDGLVHFLGRADTVRKVNGHRIDLSEVETCITRAPGVDEAAVLVAEINGQEQIVAAVSARADGATALSVRLHAMQSLPAYAIPKRINIFNEPLPKNSNGKICRRTLAARAWVPPASPS